MTCSIWGYHFRNKKAIIAKFSHPLVYLTPPLRGFPWNFVMAVELKNRTYETVKKCDDMCIHLNTIA